MRGVAFSAMLAVTAVAGCTDQELGKEATEVEVDDNSFEVEGEPETKNGEATARAGDTFEFKNEGNVRHSVTVHRPPDPATTTIKDVDLEAGRETTLTFDKAGTYHIWCKYHGELGQRMHLNVTAP